MIVKSSSGMNVSIIHNDKKSLYDVGGGKWDRNPNYDDADKKLIAFVNVDTLDMLQLTIEEMKRVIAGKSALNTPTTVEEMWDLVNRSSKRIQSIASKWMDQHIREILIEAEENGSNPVLLLEKAVDREIERTTPSKKPTEAPPVATEAPKTSRTGRNTTRPRKQEGSVTVSLGDISVLLTPKQLEFMERLSECPGWDGTPTGKYNASEYSQELSDTMNPMSMGAVLTTLREKGLLRTEKCRVGAIKCCIFQLTDTGIKVYNELAGGRANG